MKKAHALGAALVGLALTATGVLAATPSAVSVIARDRTALGGPQDNHGGAVSIAAKATGKGTSDGSTSTGDAPSTDGSTGSAPTTNHGTTVSAVAQDHTTVGGPNNNHGGAVSAIARGTHGKPAAPGKSTTHPAPH